MWSRDNVRFAWNGRRKLLLHKFYCLKSGMWWILSFFYSEFQKRAGTQGDIIKKISIAYCRKPKGKKVKCCLASSFESSQSCSFGKVQTVNSISKAMTIIWINMTFNVLNSYHRLVTGWKGADTWDISITSMGVCSGFCDFFF